MDTGDAPTEDSSTPEPVMAEAGPRFIDLKRRDRTLDRLYDYWILGRAADRAEPRWCVIRDVLGWVE